MVTEIQKGRVTRLRSADNPLFKGNICIKGIVAPKNFATPDRVPYPQRHVGEREAGRWQRMSWVEAMADIGQRLKKIIAEHG